jgi:hypothetical protein
MICIVATRRQHRERDFMDQCADQSGEGISPDVAALLTADAAHVLTRI